MNLTPEGQKTMMEVLLWLCIALFVAVCCAILVSCATPGATKYLNPWQIQFEEGAIIEDNSGGFLVIGDSAGNVIYSTASDYDIFDGDLNLATIRPDYVIEVLGNPEELPPDMEENIVEWKGNNHGPQ